MNRPFYLSVTLICALLLGFGYYLEFINGLAPCPLCIFQRLAYMGVGIFCLVGFLHGPGIAGARIYSGLALLSAATGAGIAMRQVWLQHLPAELTPECGPGLDFMLEVFPIFETIKMVFTGSGECAEITWTFLSLSIAEWSLFWFAALSILLASHLFSRN